jgi:hypothetical protein
MGCDLDAIERNIRAEHYDKNPRNLNQAHITHFCIFKVIYLVKELAIARHTS